MTYDVAIVGMGPVGSTAAILFAEAGLNVLAIEKDSEVYQLPRAVNLDGEIIRAFQKVGRGQVVQELMQTVRPDDRVGFVDSKHRWLFGQQFREFGMNGWQPMNMFDQPEFETYLRSEATGHDGVTALVGYEATGIRNDGDDVVIGYRPVAGDGFELARASYAVACDGAGSPTRRSLGIGWVDLGYDHDWLVVDVVVRDGHTLSQDTVQVCDPERLATYVCTKDPFRRWEFKLNPGETRDEMLREERICSLIDPWTPSGTYEIRRAAVYQFHAATADRWRDGNIFLAGDAAHQTPPFLGQGMNSGMRDVINLAWKLPLVIDGMAKDELLNSYFDERNSHAHDLVDWAVSIGRLMEHLAEVERCAAEGLPAPVQQSSLRSSGYGQGREQPPIRDGVVLLDQVNDTGSTGYLFSQPVVRDNGGNEVRLDELLGPGFALVARQASELQLNESSRQLLATLNVRVLALDDMTPVRGHFDRVFEKEKVALVRPDRLVFGHTSTVLSADALVNALAEKLDLVTRTGDES